MKAWTLLLRNPMIVVVCVLAGLASAGARMLVEGGMSTFAISGDGSANALDAIAAFTQMLLFVTALAVSLVQMAYVTGMAGAAWRSGHARLSDGWNALAHRLPSLAAAFALLMIIGFCAAALASVTFWITVAAYAIFFIYTIAGVVIGERPPIAAIVDSASLALRHMLPTIGVIALVAIVAIAGAILGQMVAGVNKDAGWLVAGLLQQVVVAYATLVIAGEYLVLASPHADSGS